MTEIKFEIIEHVGIFCECNKGTMLSVEEAKEVCTYLKNKIYVGLISPLYCTATDLLFWKSKIIKMRIKPIGI